MGFIVGVVLTCEGVPGKDRLKIVTGMGVYTYEDVCIYMYEGTHIYIYIKIYVYIYRYICICIRYIFIVS
jgi:hypothetical protein